MSTSEAFSDELEAVNAIFGENTCQVIGTDSQKTRVQLRLPAASYESFAPKLIGRHKDRMVGSWKRITLGSGITFVADFPIEYPQVMPEIVYLDVSLLEYYEANMWKVHVALVLFLKDVFRAGDVCIYDWFLKCTPAIHCLGRDGLDWAKFVKTAPELTFDEKAWRWALRREPMEVDEALEQRECTICLDEHIGCEMVDLDCGHVFCIDCFHGKLSFFPTLLLAAGTCVYLIRMYFAPALLGVV